MEFLGIGPTELIAILLIVFLVMGPQDLIKIGGTLGRTLRNLRRSDTWRSIQDAGRQLRELPDNLARQAGIDEIEEIQRELRNEVKEQKAVLEDLDKEIVAWTRTPDPLSQKSKPPKEQPPADEPGGEEA